MPDERDRELDKMVRALRSEMGPQSVPQDDPARSVIAMLGDRWSPLILLVLSAGEWRQANLRRAVSELAIEPEISQRILTLKLRALERDGFIYRETSKDVPPHVSYGLTELGIELVRRQRTLLRWLEEQRPSIWASRAKFDQNKFDDAGLSNQ